MIGIILSELKETCGRTIDLIKQQIIFNGEVIQVRPKTFQLLLQFIKNPQQLITKKILFETVWDDVEVSEQVLFQTIRELRGLFEGVDVIKTQPRKGYIWTAPVITHTTTKNKYSTLKTKVSHLMLVVVISFAAIILLYSTFKAESEMLNGSLVILPVKSEMNDNIHNWVYLGAMERLISHFSSDESFAVLSPEDVLQIMKEANLRKSYTQKELLKIFNVSGANLVVESTLSGFMNDYQLKYNLYFREGVNRGIVFDSSVNGVIEKLASIVASKTGNSIEQINEHYHFDFSNGLLLKAIEKKEHYEYEASNNLLAALLIEDNENIVAHRTMAANFIALRMLDDAENSLNQAHQLAIQLKTSELPVIYYNRAVIDYLRKDLVKALENLALTEESAKEHNDWLYQAYSNELKGKILLNTGELKLAKASFVQAMEQYAVIQCPVGTSLVLMNLSYVTKLIGDDLLASDYLQQANKIIDQRELTFLTDELTRFKNKIL